MYDDVQDEIEKLRDTVVRLGENVFEMRLQLLAARMVLWEALAMSGLDIEALRLRAVGLQYLADELGLATKTQRGVPEAIAHHISMLLDCAVAAKDRVSGFEC